MAREIVWTPEAAQGEGLVILPRRPLRPLELAEYQERLAERLTAMLEANPEEAEEMMLQRVWEIDRLELGGKEPQMMARLLVELSGSLRRLTGMDATEWPIKPSQIKPDQEWTPEELREMDQEPGAIADLVGRMERA